MYLGVTIHERGEQKLDLNKRIKAANRLYYSIGRGIFKKKEITRDRGTIPTSLNLQVREFGVDAEDESSIGGGGDEVFKR